MNRNQIGIGAVALLSLIGAGLVLAAPPSSNTHAADKNSTATPGSTGNNKKLAGLNLTSCKAKEAGITKRSKQMTDRATRMESKFADIASKVDLYYTTKLVPENKTVSNYSTLKSDIDTKKAAVDTALSTSQADLTNFSCTADDPKGALTSFKTDMQNVNTALKNYRSSIKDFTQALHKAAGNPTATTPSSTPSSSPETGE